MTQEDFNSKYGRLSMPCPFGNNDSANTADIAATASASDFNFETGFATQYSAPSSNGGMFVKRMEMNAIGNLASRNDFYRMCGGLNTFDSAIADAINGYPKGAVLDYIVGYKLYKVISLVDANKVDLIANGVDGVNWQYLNLLDVDPTKTEMFSFDFKGNNYGLIGVFKCAKDSNTFSFENSIETSISGTTSSQITLPSGNSIFKQNGFAFAIYDLGEQYTEISVAPSFYYTFDTTTGIVTINASSNGWIKLFGSLAGTIYSIKAGAGTVDIHSSDYAFDQFTGFKNGHFYAVSAFGGFKNNIYLGQEQNSASTLKLSFTEQTLYCNGTFKIFY